MPTRHTADARLVDHVPVLGHAFRASTHITGAYTCARCGWVVIAHPDRNPERDIMRTVTLVGLRCQGEAIA